MAEYGNGFPDEKTPPSPTDTTATAVEDRDPESGKILRAPTWTNRFLGVGKQPNATAAEVQELRKTMTTEIKRTETRSLDECPNGYPRLAAFMSSESNFSLYRGFDYLHARVLLSLQDEIVELEQELDELDAADDNDKRVKNLKTLRWDKNPKRARPIEDGFRSRTEILDDIRRKLLEYDEMLIKSREVQAFQKPSERDYRNVRTYFWNEAPIGNDAESCFIKKKEDIISLRSGVR